VVRKNSKYRHIGLQVYFFEKFKSKIAFPKAFKAAHFNIVIVNSGSLFIQINDKEVRVLENELLLIPLRSSCEILITSDSLQFCLVSFTPEFIFENSIRGQHLGYFDFYIRKLSSKIYIKDKNLQHLIFLFEQLHHKAQKSSKQIFKEEVLLFSFNLFLYVLAEKHNNYFQELSENYTIKEKLLIQFFKILGMNCRKQHCVKYYADVLSMTPGNLTKIIKELTQKTAKHFIDQAIVIEAKNLLENKDLSILSIIEELQFIDSSAFSNFFKRHTSLSPTEYRTRLNLH
jgi:AraC family transcriptional activator of pobA